MDVKFDELFSTHLYKDATYQSNSTNSFSGEVISKILGVSNQSGFRKKLDESKTRIAYVALESNNKHKKFLDVIQFDHVVYCGDNDKNIDIHSTKQGGNIILRQVFNDYKHEKRRNIPPFFYFKATEGRDRKFIGILVPGYSGINKNDSLEIFTIDVKNLVRNYRAHFTILSVPFIDRQWLDDLIHNNGYESRYAPMEWKDWIDMK